MSLQVRKNNFLLQDISIILLSILIAIILVKSGILTKILTSSGQWLLGSFVAGIFFTSVFTTAPAIVTFGEITQNNSIFLVAFLGALGAVIGDLIIWRFMEDRLGNHLTELLKHTGGGKRVKALFKRKFWRWLTFIVGGLIIASPLPDELGISLLGFSRMKTLWFIMLSFTFNFIGIVLIGLLAKTL